MIRNRKKNLKMEILKVKQIEQRIPMRTRKSLKDQHMRILQETL